MTSLSSDGWTCPVYASRSINSDAIGEAGVLIAALARPRAATTRGCRLAISKLLRETPALEESALRFVEALRRAGQSDESRARRGTAVWTRPSASTTRMPFGLQLGALVTGAGAAPFRRSGASGEAWRVWARASARASDLLAGGRRPSGARSGAALCARQRSVPITSKKPIVSSAVPIPRPARRCLRARAPGASRSGWGACLAPSVAARCPRRFRAQPPPRALAHSQIDQGWAHLQLRAIGVARGGERLAAPARWVTSAACCAPGNFWPIWMRAAPRAVAAIAGSRAAPPHFTMAPCAEAVVGMAFAHFMEDTRAVRALRGQTLLGAVPPWQAHISGRRLTWRIRCVGTSLPRCRAGCVVSAPRCVAAACASDRRMHGAVRLRVGARGPAARCRPVLKEALSAASRPDAVAWTERFLSVSAVDVRQWIASLATGSDTRTGRAARGAACLRGSRAAMCVSGNLHLHRVGAVFAGAGSTSKRCSRPRDRVSCRPPGGRGGARIIAGQRNWCSPYSRTGLVEFLAAQQQLIARSSVLGACRLEVTMIFRGSLR